MTSQIAEILSDFVDEATLAAQFNVDRSTLYRWRRRKKPLPHLQLPSGRILYDAKEVKRWLRSCRVRPARRRSSKGRR